MKINEEFLELIRIKEPLPAVMKEYTEIKGNSCKCPFCNSKDFVLHIHKERYFNCYSCGESGDVFGFLCKSEGMPFSGLVKYLAKTLNLYTPDELENKKPFRFWEHFKMLCEFHGINADNEISSFGFMLSRDYILSLKYSKSDFNTENLETLFSAKWNVGQVYWSMTKKEAEEYLNYHFKNRKDLP